MEKQKKQLLILLVLLVVCVAALFGLHFWQQHQQEKEEQEEAAKIITVASLDVDGITSFSYQLEGQELSFEKEEDTWYYSADKSIPITQTMITTMLGKLSEVTADQQITDPADLAEYGFDQPTNVITVQLSDSQMVFTVGMYNSMTGQYYLMVSGDENVYLVDSTLISSFQKSVEDVTEESEETQE